MTEQEKVWLEERKHGIGGSDAAAIVGKNPWKSNVVLWEEKTGRIDPKDISNHPNVIYGKQMEPILRMSFQIKHPEYEVQHEEYKIIKHPKYPFLFASLDGVLIDKNTGEMGILEIKTSETLRTMQKEKWKDGVPDCYFLQCLHYLNVTGYSFVRVFAELKYSWDFQMNKTFEINRSDYEEDIKYLEQQEIKFWKDYVEKDIEPPRILPEI